MTHHRALIVRDYSVEVLDFGCADNAVERAENCEMWVCEHYGDMAIKTLGDINGQDHVVIYYVARGACKDSKQMLMDNLRRMQEERD